MTENPFNKVEDDCNALTRATLFKGSEKSTLTLENLKKQIIQFIQIENLNILIGAGCSSYLVSDVEQAIPTMVSMSEEFYDKYKDNSILNINIRGDRLFDDESVRSNLELLMNRLISIEIAFSSERDNITTMKNLVNSFIFEKVSMDPCPALLDLYQEMYMRLEKKTRRTPINIYTTNYDLYNENALDILGTPYNNGFLGSARRAFNPNSYNYILVEDLNLSKDSWKSVSNFINLYKIHGSINWIKEDGLIVEKDIESARKNQNSMIIYPTPQKDRSTLMAPYSDLFRMMQNNLLKPNSVLITIGYSYSDEHVNRIIFNALSSHNFRLVIFGDSEHIDKIISKNNKRIWVINSENKIHHFKNFVKCVLPELNEDQRKKHEERETLITLFNDLVETKQP